MTKLSAIPDRPEASPLCRYLLGEAETLFAQADNDYEQLQVIYRRSISKARSDVHGNLLPAVRADQTRWDEKLTERRAAQARRHATAPRRGFFNRQSVLNDDARFLDEQDKRFEARAAAVLAEKSDQIEDYLGRLDTQLSQAHLEREESAASSYLIKLTDIQEQLIAADPVLSLGVPARANRFCCDIPGLHRQVRETLAPLCDLHPIQHVMRVQSDFIEDTRAFRHIHLPAQDRGLQTLVETAQLNLLAVGIGAPVVLADSRFIPEAWTAHAARFAEGVMAGHNATPMLNAVRQHLLMSKPGRQPHIASRNVEAPYFSPAARP